MQPGQVGAREPQGQEAQDNLRQVRVVLGVRPPDAEVGQDTRVWVRARQGALEPAEGGVLRVGDGARLVGLDGLQLDVQAGEDPLQACAHALDRFPRQEPQLQRGAGLPGEDVVRGARVEPGHGQGRAHHGRGLRVVEEAAEDQALEQRPVGQGEAHRRRGLGGEPVQVMGRGAVEPRGEGLGLEPQDGLRQPRHRAVGRGEGRVPSRAARREAQGQVALLRDADQGDRTLQSGHAVLQDEPALVEHAGEALAVRAQPLGEDACARVAPDLLVVAEGEDEVVPRSASLLEQRLDGLEPAQERALVVQRAAAVQHVVDHASLEGRVLPRLRVVGGDDVEVREDEPGGAVGVLPLPAQQMRAAQALVDELRVDPREGAAQVAREALERLRVRRRVVA